MSEPAQILDEAPLLVQESIEEIKEELVEKTISEKGTAKEFASYTTHQILDEVSDYGLKHVVGEETIEVGHELIDRAFGTDYASEYTEESKEEIASLKKELGAEMTLGVLPPPTAPVGAVARTGTAIGSAIVAQEVIAGASVANGTLANADSGSSQNYDFGKGDLALDKLIEAGKEPDRKELTRAGRALEKHGNRSDSVFPKPTGTPSQINEQGQVMLEIILNSPSAKVIKLPNGNMKIYNELGQGAYFSVDGKFIGFIEAQYEQKN